MSSHAKVLLSEFERGYIRAMLWSSTYDHKGDPIYFGPGDATEACDAMVSDIEPETIRKAIADCARFLSLPGVLEALADGDEDQAGHDFALSRNRSGSGFIDCDDIDKGRLLVKAAHRMGEVVWFRDAEGRISQ